MTPSSSAASDMVGLGRLVSLLLVTLSRGFSDDVRGAARCNVARVARRLAVRRDVAHVKRVWAREVRERRECEGRFHTGAVPGVGGLDVCG